MSDEKGTKGGRRVEAGFGATGEALPGMPLRVIVAAELTPRDLKTGKSEEVRRKIRIDKETFDDVMSRMGLRVTLDVADRLSGGTKPLLVDLAFKDLKAFRPDAVAAQIPATRDLLKLRAALADLRGAKVRLADVKSVLASLQTRSAVIESVRRALEAPPEAPAPAAGPARPAVASEAGGLDALLSMVEAPEAAEETRRGADLDRLDALIRHLVKSDRAAEKADGRAVGAAIREIDQALSAQIDEVLHHAEFRRLESTWRGLRFLTDRTDFRQPLRIEVLATGRETLLPVYDELIQVPESQGVSSEPVSFVIVDQVFDKTPEDCDLLTALGQRGASLSVPILASVGAPFLGLAKAGDLARARGLKDAFTSPEFVKYQGLRESGASRWLGLIFNRLLLRPAYAPGEKETRDFTYVERIPAGADELRLWGNPVWALGSLCTRSFARTGWCTDIMGQRTSGMAEDLPVRLYERPGAEEVSFPLETVITDDVERDLSNNGIMALSAALNSDRAYLRFAPTAHAPQHYQDPADKARARLQSTLPFQMFVGRLVNYAMLIEGTVVPGRGPEQIAAAYTQALRGLMGSAGAVPPDAVKVEVPPNEEDPSKQDLHLKVRWPGFQSLPGAGEVELRWPLMM